MSIKNYANSKKLATKSREVAKSIRDNMKLLNNAHTAPKRAKTGKKRTRTNGMKFADVKQDFTVLLQKDCKKVIDKD